MDSAAVAVASSIAQAAVKGGLAAVVKIGLTAPPVGDEAPFIEPADDGSDVEAFPDEEEEDASFP